MKERINNKFTNQSSKNSTIILFFIFVAFIVSSYFFFQSYKNTLIKKASDNYELNINYLNAKLDRNVLRHDKSSVKEDIKKLIDTKIFESIIIHNTRFIFDKNSLINASKEFNDKSWSLAEVIVDAKYGYINKIPKTSLYEFIPSNQYDPSQAISIRYQVYKKGSIKRVITKLDFSNIEVFEDSNKSIKSWMDSFIDIDTSNRIYNLKVDNMVVATVVYIFNNNILKEQLESFLIKLLLFNIILFLPIIFVLGFYHKYLFKKYVTEPVTYANQYLDNILENKFTTLNKNKFEGTEEIKELTKKITKVSSKIASLKNELNVNKESLELKVSTDGLTGLPNKNIFDFDIKTMFVSMVNGYVFLVRLDNLSQISKNHDSGYINSFIESYVNIIKNIIFKYSKTDMKLYRFYGSQFAIIARNIDVSQARQMCEEIIEELTDRMPDIYDVPEDLVQIGGTAFDLYGSLDTILNSANNAYEISKKKGVNSYHIIGEDDIEKNYSLLDNSVIEVIQKAEFSISYVLDSYLFDDPEKLVMNEASPQLYDHDNKKLQIGSFVSVAQKLNMADEFDKIVIQKVINDIKQKQFQHEVAINLSISSIENDEFMQWLSNILKENESILKNIVFSITSYTAYLHKNSFAKFIEDIHKIGSKVLLKRYKTDEYPLTQLEFLDLDYIRMNQDYTTNFTNDIVKKHKVKNVLIFAELNDINVIADSVKLDADYDLLERLGTYATSR